MGPHGPNRASFLMNPMYSIARTRQCPRKSCSPRQPMAAYMWNGLQPVTSLTLIPNPKGTFRTDYTPSDGGMVTELVGEALQKYIIDTCSVNEVPGVWFEEWIRLIMARLKDRLTEMNSDNSFTPDRSSGRQYKGAIKALQQDFAICTADKASSTYVLVCKHHLASQVEVD